MRSRTQKCQTAECSMAHNHITITECNMAHNQITITECSVANRRGSSPHDFIMMFEGILKALPSHLAKQNSRLKAVAEPRYLLIDLSLRNFVTGFWSVNWSPFPAR